MNKFLQLIVGWICTSFICGCCPVDYQRGEVALPIPHCRSMTQSNFPAADTSQLAGYAYPGSARSLRKEGSWFKDAYDRYVLFRGVNLNSQAKLRPFYFPLRINSYADFNSESNRIAPCLDSLQSLGFNVVRLVVIWKALEPFPNTAPSESYLKALESLIDSLYRRGLFVFIDFHQDIASDLYGGDGFPDWALFVDNRHPLRRLPPGPCSHWYFRYENLWPPLNMCLDPHWPWEVPLNRLVRKTQCSFWENSCDNAVWNLQKYPTQSELIRMIGSVAVRWSTNPAVIGYEPFNEPNGCGIERDIFEEHYLTSFYTNVLHELRAESKDTNSFLFAEPRTDWNFHATNASESGLCFISNGQQLHSFLGEGNSNSFVSPGGTNDAERGVFAFHFYDSWTTFWAGLHFRDSMANKQMEWPGMFRAMVKAAKDRNLIPFMTEFGVENRWRRFSTDLKKGVYDTEDRAYLDLCLRQVEANCLNAALWEYDFYASDPPNGSNWNDENFSLLAQVKPNSWVVRNADIIARPYPLRSSARPELLYFDLESKQAAIILAGKPVEAPTMIYVPRDIQYTNKFEVAATGPLLKWDDDKQILFWKPNPELAKNQIVIHPPGELRTNALPSEVRELLNTTTNHMLYGP